MRIMLTISKVFAILLLLCLWKYRIPGKFIQKISKLFFQMSGHIYFLLGQTDEGRRYLLEVTGEVQGEITSKGTELL